MQKFFTRRAITCISLVVIVGGILFVTSGFTFEQGSPSQSAAAKSGVGEAQEFLRSLFPELLAKKYVMTVEASGAFDLDLSRLPVFSVYVGRSERGHKDMLANVPAENSVVEDMPILTGLFEFGRDAVLDEVNIHSPEIVADNKNENLRRLVDAHRDWSDDRVKKALKDAGAKYGPENRELLLQSIPLKALEPFTGTLQIESTEFRLRDQQLSPRDTLAIFGWMVDAVSVAPNGRRTHWSLYFEPFGGRLTDLYRSLSDR
jgi:hypothetical protein